MKTKVFIVIIIFLLLTLPFVSSLTLRQGEVYEVKQKEIIIESIKFDKVKVNVEGVRNIINVGEKKEVNGVDISVESIFYVDEPEERTVTAAIDISFYCGDENCDTENNETKENCCDDCGCSQGFICSEKICKSEEQIKKEEAEEGKSKDECEKDINCDDNNPDTEDTCKRTPGKPNKCLHIPPICNTDLDCDDTDPCTVDRCNNKDCFNTEVPDYEACLKKNEVEEVSKTLSEEIKKDFNETSKGVKEKSFFSSIMQMLFSWFK